MIPNFVIKFKDETNLMKIINGHFLGMKNESITISSLEQKILLNLSNSIFISINSIKLEGAIQSNLNH
jgi:hypothetical protein